MKTRISPSAIFALSSRAAHRASLSSGVGGDVVAIGEHRIVIFPEHGAVRVDQQGSERCISGRPPVAASSIALRKILRRRVSLLLRSCRVATFQPIQHRADWNSRAVRSPAAR